MSEYFLDPNTGRRVKKESNTPIWKRSNLSPYDYARQSDIIKEIFKKCPTCNGYSLKPNYNMNLLTNKNDIYAISTVKGRKCTRCGYIIAPSPIYSYKDDTGLY